MDFSGEIIGMVGTIASIAAFWIIFENNRTAVRLNRSERFKNSIEQLGSDKKPVVLGAIYSLHRNAVEDETYGENVFNILCAYVRDTTAESDYQKKYTQKPSEPVQAVLNLLCINPKDLGIYTRLSAKWYGRLWQKLRKQNISKYTPDFSHAFLQKANLSGAQLQEADLSSAQLQGATLYNANLQEANLQNANLQGAFLYDANLQEAFLHDANLQEANLSSAQLQEASLSSAQLQGAKLHNADLLGAFLYNANLQGAFLYDANLLGAVLYNAQLQGANLQNAKLQGADLSQAQLQGAYSSLEGFGGFEERILSRRGQDTDLSGIGGGFNPASPPFKGTPIMGILTPEDAKKIIADFKKQEEQRG